MNRTTWYFLVKALLGVIRKVDGTEVKTFYGVRVKDPISLEEIKGTDGEYLRVFSDRWVASSVVDIDDKATYPSATAASSRLSEIAKQNTLKCEVAETTKPHLDPTKSFSSKQSLQCDDALRANLLAALQAEKAKQQQAMAQQAKGQQKETGKETPQPKPKTPVIAGGKSKKSNKRQNSSASSTDSTPKR